MNWLAVRVRPSASPDAALAALFQLGSEGVHETDVELVTHFPGDADSATIISAVMAADPAAQVTASLVPAVDWSEEWKRGVGAHDLGALSIVPPWLADGRDPAHTIVIEPEMAFGTGEHQTTRGVVRLLPRVVRRGDRVADLGAGSAVLAIAAAKLGAAHVTAIELDHDAIANAEENVARNGVSDRVTVIEGDAALLLPFIAPVRVVLANIISSVLVVLLPTIAASLAVDGAAVLSGILVEEREAMRQVLDAGGWLVIEDDVEGIWWSAHIARR
ncbi:MAG: 50S ribosomal protein L11 methyltransferase [Gemmatimonadaceae bacterium]|nr:50S ribosomal protein L11 methyltransferase [Gemmatimonadaceae bacterium]